MDPVKIDPAQHLGLVRSIANKWSKRCLDIPCEDLVQEGMIGLLKACDKFDPNRGVAFATMAHWWISAEIGRAIANKAREIRLPYRVFQQLKKQNDLPPYHRRLDAPLSAEGGSLHDVLPNRNPGPEQLFEEAERDYIVRRQIGRLPKRTQEILRMRFEEGLSLEETGQRLGRTRERIRQIEEQALARLRPRFEAAL